MLKQKKDGSWLIQTADDLDAAVAAIEDRQEALAELERQMEEQYDYLTMKKEIEDLQETIRGFMADNDVKHIFRDDYKMTLIRRHSTSWNPDKLRKLLPKNLWLRVTKQVIDPGKIDDLVREGKIDDKKIAPALEQKPQRPFLQRYEYKEGQDKEAAVAEEMALRRAMSGTDAPPKKRGKK